MPPSAIQQIRIDPLAVFKARAEARAILWAACEIDLHEAVDVLQADAVSTGLVAGLGQDAVQAILADAFHRLGARGAAMNWNDPSWKTAAREYHVNRKARQLRQLARQQGQCIPGELGKQQR